jgi:predicted RNA-binding Zn-ribbon protein involved in translation (DUF1610 family)
MPACHGCGTELDLRQRIYRNTVCPSCGKELHICLNCRFYTPGAHWDCRENIPDQVREKDRANFCDYFSLSDSGNSTDAARTRDAAKQKAEQAKSRLDNLFGNE